MTPKIKLLKNVFIRQSIETREDEENNFEYSIIPKNAKADKISVA